MASSTQSPQMPASVRGARLLQWTGPYLTLVQLLIAGLAVMSLSRAGLMLWQWDRVTAAGSVGQMLVQGVRADLILLGYFLVPPLMLAPFLAHGYAATLWKRLTLFWSCAVLLFIVFMELASPQFIMQFDARPNRLFIEYLSYPAEVFATLWHGFRAAVLASIAGTVLAAVILLRVLRSGQRHLRMWPARKVLLTWPLLLIAVFFQIRSTTAHRPANTALFALTGDAMVNALVINSSWSVLDAIASMRKEANSSEIYGAMERATVLDTVKAAPWLKDYAFPSNDLPTLHRQHASAARTRPLNLVIVLEESLGATFVQSLGGLPVTPELEKLKHEGWWFEQLYATGTRSVRGIEAVVAGFAPTPARSVVKLSLAQQNFYTLALGLGQQGYHTEFVYGGEAHFDNMRGFFTGNGFQKVVDRRDMKPVFEGSWGASDEDLFNKSLERLATLHAAGQPFFSLIFSSSNHEPFEYPEGRIAQHDPVRQTVNNAVKYADHALGKFIAAARTQAYWKDTIFLIVADHDNRVYGNSIVPIKKFHIPGLILGADITPRRITPIASQIDLAPTLLSLLGVSSSHPMIGRDFARDSDSPGRALLQFENSFAWLDDSGATILRPSQAPVHGRYNQASGELAMETRAATADETRTAMAHVILPSLLYREQRYRLAR